MSDLIEIISHDTLSDESRDDPDKDEQVSDLDEIISYNKSPDEAREDPDKDEQGPLIKISPDGEYFVICIGKKFVGCNFDEIEKGIQVDDYIVREKTEK